ncbi:hypothetical protein ACWGOQ_0017160 [Aquimarina sp. M1]
MFPVFCFAQSEEEIIIEIRNEFNRINNLQSLEKIDLFNDEFLNFTPDGGGQLSGYFENDQLVKIVKWIGPSFGIIVTEYYLKNDKIIFAFNTEKKFKDIFDASGEWMHLDTSVAENKFEARYYFHNESLIRQIEKGKRITESSFHKETFIRNMHTLGKLLKKKIN